MALTGKWADHGSDNGLAFQVRGQHLRVVWNGVCYVSTTRQHRDFKKIAEAYSPDEKIIKLFYSRSLYVIGYETKYQTMTIARPTPLDYIKRLFGGVV